MITLKDLEGSFEPVENIGGAIVRCVDEFRDHSNYTYVKMATGSTADILLKSVALSDDEFARTILSALEAYIPGDYPCKVKAPENRFGFSHLLYLTSEYHGELVGRLDSKRAHTLLCVPIFEAEFSGTETPSEFKAIRRSSTPIDDWSRDIKPRIKFRFENSRTGAGTGDGYVFCDIDLVMSEVRNLVGDPDGFLEILNFRDRVMEIIYSPQEGLGALFDRNDENIRLFDVSALDQILWDFLTI